jgi:hypothetical protein
MDTIKAYEYDNRRDGCELNFILSPKKRYVIHGDDSNYGCIVMTVEEKENGNLYIEAIPFGESENARKYIEKYKGDNWKDSFDWFYKEAPIEVWDDKFDVVKENEK